MKDIEKKDFEVSNKEEPEVQDMHKNGFGKICWFLMFITFHVLLGVMIWITFWIADREHFLATMPIVAYLIWQIVVNWAAISNSKGFPVFKAARRMKNPFARGTAKKPDIDDENV